MNKSGLADSPLFTRAVPGATTSPQQPAIDTQAETAQKKRTAAHEDTADGSEQQTQHATTLPRHHGITPPRNHGSVVEVVRRAVKDFGKEAATHRFTVTEKQAIADLVYTFQKRGVRTSENEITRIAINFIIDDCEVNGADSILEKVLQALNG